MRLSTGWCCLDFIESFLISFARFLSCKPLEVCELNLKTVVAKVDIKSGLGWDNHLCRSSRCLRLF
jgi:hypothetical protein